MLANSRIKTDLIRSHLTASIASPSASCKLTAVARLTSQSDHRVGDLGKPRLPHPRRSLLLDVVDAHVLQVRCLRLRSISAELLKAAMIRAVACARDCARRSPRRTAKPGQKKRVKGAPKMAGTRRAKSSHIEASRHACTIDFDRPANETAERMDAH